MGTESDKGQKAGIEILVRKSPAGLTRVSERVLPCTAMPEMCCALPARYADTPAMSEASDGPADQTFFGESDRSSVCWNVREVTASFEGGEKRKPRRMRKL